MKKPQFSIPKPSATVILVIVLAAVALFFLLSPEAVNPLADLNADDVELVAVLAFSRVAVLSEEQEDELVALLREVECRGTDTGFYMGSSVSSTIYMKDGRTIDMQVSGYYYKVDGNAYRIDAGQGDAIAALLLSATPVS